MTEDSTEENRLLDEALKHMTNGKTRIEDMQKLAEQTGLSMHNLAKHVLGEIFDNVRKQAEWSMSRGAPPISQLKSYFAIQNTLLAFLNTLIEMWQDVATQSMGQENLKHFKEILGEKEKE